MSKPRKTLRFNRAKWLPYEVQKVLGMKSVLYNKRVRRACCLGLDILASKRIAKRFIEGRVSPGTVKGLYPGVKMGSYLLKDDETSKFSHEAAIANDNGNISLAQRESKIIELFASIDRPVEFYGDLWEGLEEFRPKEDSS